jgi:polysaccharide deacetylase 2 family uncharacterized protein YibQ
MKFKGNWPSTTSTSHWPVLPRQTPYGEPSLTSHGATHGDVLRFDFSRRGNRTHTIQVITPLPARPRQLVEHARAVPRLAIVIDDLGYDQSVADALLALPFPLTASVLPNLLLSTQVAEQAYRRGDQVLLHLPMESESEAAKREGIELRVGMSAKQVESALSGMLKTVPHVAGINNHEGSRGSADPALMDALMPALSRRGLFFIDSRTTAKTVAYQAAKRSGVRAASRKVFLDDTPTREAILEQLDLAARDAMRDGSAIAIGHPHPATIRRAQRWCAAPRSPWYPAGLRLRGRAVAAASPVTPYRYGYQPKSGLAAHSPPPFWWLSCFYQPC